MAKLIPMNEAAQILGLTVDQLNKLRSQNKISGYRDGSNWKFKEEDIQRVAAQRASVAEPELDELDTLDSGAGIDDDLDKLVDVAEVPGLDDASSEDGDDDTLESELRLAPDDSDVLDFSAEGSSDKDDEGGADTANLGDAIAEAEEDLSVDADELRLATDDDFNLTTSEPVLADDDDSDDFSLSEADLELEAESDADLVLKSDDELGSPAASDTSDSGIELAGISDDSISPEDAPTELGGASLDNIELGEDDMVSVADDFAESDDMTQLKADGDFLLTPVDEGSGMDESDSGSQVIELDEEFEGAELVEEAAVEQVEEDIGLEAAEEATAGAAMPARVSSADEFSLWNVMGLVLIFVIFLPTGIMMIDLMRNMWSWNGPNSLNSAMMDAILGVFGG